MKLKMDDDLKADVNIELPIQDLEDFVIKTATQVILVIGFYMLADSARHILKEVIK